MANLFFIWDEDTERRNAFCETAIKEIAPFPNAHTKIHIKENWSVLWAANPRAPIDIHETESELSVIWGKPIDPSNGKQVNAKTLLARWRNIERDRPKAMDGFHAASVFHRNGEVTLGVDLIGLFPLYYTQIKEVLLIGSSPELFRLHPSFKPEFNPLALTDLLLNMFGSLGETLWKGIVRLPPGHLLTRTPRAQLRTIKQYSLPTEIPASKEKPRVYVDRLDAALESAMRRIVPNSTPHTLMLSGGLDSRLIVGYMKALDVPTHTLTMGIPTDLEMQCAMRVANTLELPLSAIDFSENEEVSAAKRKTKWEHGLAGYVSGIAWALPARLNAFDPDIVSAYLANDIIGLKKNALRFPPNTPLSFETAFRFNNQSGLNPEIIRRLVRPEVLGETLDEAIDRSRQIYESYSNDEFIRTRCYQLHTRQRFYTGGVFWPHSFGAWPAAPMLDQHLIHTNAIIPADIADHRRIENALLAQRFPALASIPLDRNTFDTSPILVHPLKRFLGHFVEKMNPQKTIQIHHLGQLYYQRDLFDEHLLKELLPEADKTVPFTHPIKESSSRKTLISLILWAKDHL